MKYNFDEIIDRTGTSTYKHGKTKLFFGTDEVLPLWVADMDFASPDFVLDAINKRIDHRVLGYTLTDDAYYGAIVKWQKDRHGWDIQPEWIHHLSGVVPGLVMSMLTFSNEGDQVIVQPPIYPPFLSTVKRIKRKIVYNQLLETENGYQMNLEELEQQARDGAKMLLLCSPHNPGGIVWPEETLREVARIAEKYGMVVVSDEIHADLVLPGSKHIPYATLSEEAKNHCVTLVAPSKTFNIAGLGISSAIIPNEKMYRKFARMIEDMQSAPGNLIGFEATKAAYSAKGHDWLDQLLVYIQGNVDYVINFIEKNIPEIKPLRPQASFLVWLDCRGLKMTDDELKDFMVLKAGLGFNQGPTFGPGGSGFQRVNVGAPRGVLQEAMQKLYDAYKTL